MYICIYIYIYMKNVFKYCPKCFLKYNSRFPSGSKKWKSNNDYKHGLGQEKRTPSTLCWGKREYCSPVFIALMHGALWYETKSSFSFLGTRTPFLFPRHGIDNCRAALTNNDLLLKIWACVQHVGLLKTMLVCIKMLACIELMVCVETCWFALILGGWHTEMLACIENVWLASKNVGLHWKHIGLHQKGCRRA